MAKEKRHKKRRTKKRELTYHQVLLSLLLIIFSYSCGYYQAKRNGIQVEYDPCLHDTTKNRWRSTGRGSVGSDENLHDTIDQLVKDRIASVVSLKNEEQISQRNDHRSLFHPQFISTMKSFVNGMVKVSASEFLELYDNGTPETHRLHDDGLIIYNTKEAVPDGTTEDLHSVKNGGALQTLRVQDATSKCDTMNVVYINPKVSDGQCLAVIGNYESYHIQKWMRTSTIQSSSTSIKDQKNIRLGKDENKGHRTSLVPVGRVTNINGHNEFNIPADSTLHQHHDILQHFLHSQSRILSELEPLVRKVASGGNVIIVMTVNFGQIDLLINFVCSAHSRKLNLSKVIVFTTDIESYKICLSLGLVAFHDTDIAVASSSKESQHYGDEVFADMMYYKVVSVLYINMLGYDVLFQDVDLIWMKYPLDFFEENQSLVKSYDLIFQDDGNRGLRMMPSSSNTGFYYICNNKMTRYLLTYLLYSGAAILQNRSHQAGMISVMNEFSSLFGLRIKILSQGDQFPGGYHFHRDKAVMKDIVHKRIVPFIFHMNWTENKKNKQRFMKQMGYWFLTCDIESTFTSLESSDNMVDNCCSQEPIVECFYKDKPSAVPCKNSPSIDKHGKSFW